MALSEIQNSKPIEDPVMPSITDIPISGSLKQKDIESTYPVSEIDKSKRSEEIKKVTEEKIERVSELMNNYVQSLQKNIKIQVNNETGDVMVKVISEKDGKVIREIPSEEMLNLAARMEELAGAFFDKMV
jgi:flagellar protein FlaG